MRPIIGITTYGRTELDVASIHYDAFFAAPAPYVDAVVRAGGVPVLLSPIDGQAQDWMRAMDGFIIAGGADVDPHHYGGQVGHPSVEQPQADRDSTEADLVRRLVADGHKPALMICRGMQVANVALGGTLLEHIPDEYSRDIHRNAAGGWINQTVDVVRGSHLYQIVQSAQMAPTSGHHQAVRDVAAGLRISATAPDGIIEALELPDHPFFHAVQWHPELTAATDPVQQRLFDGLVQASSNRSM